jgi:hypothetical protein
MRGFQKFRTPFNRYRLRPFRCLFSTQPPYVNREDFVIDVESAFYEAFVYCLQRMPAPNGGLDIGPKQTNLAYGPFGIFLPEPGEQIF